MSHYKEVNEDMQSEWDSLASHPMQSWAWGEFRKLRQPISRFGVFEGGNLKKVFLIIWTKLPYISNFFGYVPMSGMPDEHDLKELKRLAQTKKAIGIRFEPNIQSDDEIVTDLTGMVKGRSLFKPNTYWWDIEKDQTELLKNMHTKARYNIKVAQRHNVQVEEDVSNFNEYLNLLLNGTAKRQGVRFHDQKYHEVLWKVLSERNVAKLFSASYQGKKISFVMIFIWKDRIYYAYGANSLEHKEVMAPTILLWEIAQWAGQKGYKIFDLWGAEEGTGFSRFKEQFGAQKIEMLGTLDLPVNRWGYKVFRGIEEARWIIRHSSK